MDAPSAMQAVYNARGLSRGRAKGYIEGLEHRLHEAESLLLALLPLIAPDQLQIATDCLNANSISNTMGGKSRESASPSPRNMRSSPPVLNKKTGIDYWESFPLDSVENIRKWQDDCAIHSSVQPQRDCQGSFRNSMDDMHSHVRYNHQSSRPGSVDLKRESANVFASRQGQGQGQSQGQSAPFRAMSSDPYRSGTSTPVHMSSGVQEQSQTQSHHVPTSQQQTWQNLALFSPLPTPSNAQSSPGTTATSSNHNNAGMGAEALLLQSFADSNWAQQTSLNSPLSAMGMGLGGGMNNGIESGPMEIDTGFFSSDMQRRLFW
ncbi:uncharacterized protein A1O9_09090 [Exophiala aquamarina CBS 119918]|uniref:Uncharacterized protein n=1 Tax=Exophiala aquamarina CBS 119918 TaxID=1182545 RepID=A0A072P5U2_9EURO|nr:uncharacterized protein A1O9_09090 [Exophiala aquamarina CBS 119918]KEF54648.1 hypothetical protein A1O9_09090 [Exophiala aquamarina CBS 119918]